MRKTIRMRRAGSGKTGSRMSPEDVRRVVARFEERHRRERRIRAMRKETDRIFREYPLERTGCSGPVFDQYYILDFMMEDERVLDDLVHVLRVQMEGGLDEDFGHAEFRELLEAGIRIKLDDTQVLDCYSGPESPKIPLLATWYLDTVITMAERARVEDADSRAWERIAERFWRIRKAIVKAIPRAAELRLEYEARSRRKANRV